MYITKHILALLFILSVINSKAFSQLKTNTISHNLADYEFNSIFGMSKNGDNTIYCLLGNGFLRTQSSDNSDEIIETWIENNPKAKLVPVSKVTTGNEQFVYCWLVSSTDTLNIKLIREGAFPGSTMIRPREDKEKLAVSHAQLVSDSIYFDFLDKVKIANKEAFEKKIGVWANFIDN